MPSVGTSIAQKRGHSYAVTQENQGAYFFADADFDTWYAANSAFITKLGSGLYIVPGTTNGTNTLVDVLLGNGADTTELQHTNNNISDRKTILDMGKEIIMGNSTDSRLVVFRRVQRYNPSATPGSAAAGDNGYVVTENNCEDLQGNAGRFTVRVARV